MASSLISCNSVRSNIRLTHLAPSSSAFRFPTPIRFSGDLGRRKTRGLSVITRAGPSMSSYLFAFLLPLSLLAATVFTSIKIADKLDQQYLEELAINEAIRDAEEEDTDEDSSLDEESEPENEREPEPELEPELESALSRTQNWPKHEI
ncbi:hypothetical protein RJ641_036800 [Dillenia turbinata]|uniref:Uncharacterized protein n=1 Tax=Dillenia turbinata TaxID=194707 RepID=A0AAN8VPY1_9MAGN